MERSRLDLILGGVAIAALAFAVWMYAANRSLHHDVKKPKLRVARLKNALATSERVTVAEERKGSCRDCYCGTEGANG